jgi:hypothetical protein
MNQHLVVLPSTLIALSLASFGCVNKPQDFFVACDPATTCVDSKSLSGTDATRCAQNPTTDARQLFIASNRHTRRDILAVFTETIYHLNQGLPNDQHPIVRRLPANNVRTDLGCEYIRVGQGIFDQHQYVLETACFVDDTRQTCGESTIPSPAPAPVDFDCSVRCDSPMCTTYRLSQSDPFEDRVIKAMKDMTDDLLHSPLPIQTKLAGLFGGTCINRSDLLVLPGYRFSESGDTCVTRYELSSPDYTYVALYLKPHVTGRFARGSQRVVLGFDDPVQGIDVQYFDKDGSIVSEERIREIEVTRNTVKFIGTTRYCVWVEAPLG